MAVVIHLFNKYLSGICIVSDMELSTKHGPQSGVESRTYNRKFQCSVL